jgi:hypothetical protein
MRRSLRGAPLSARTGRTAERSRQALKDALQAAVLSPEGAARADYAVRE